MKVLQVHNFYQQAGGEDQVVAAEHALLSAHGHTVLQYTAHNNSVAELSGSALAVKTIWNRDTDRNIRRLIASEQIELLHVHNTLPLVSPSVYSAAAAMNVPVVQTLHNYRSVSGCYVLPPRPNLRIMFAKNSKATGRYTPLLSWQRGRERCCERNAGDPYFTGHLSA